MSEGGGPTYASLTPANPAIINGLAAVDVQGPHLAPEHGLVSMVAAVMPDHHQHHQQQQAAAALASVQDGQASSVDRNTLVAVLQFLKKNSMKVSTRHTLKA